MYFCLCCVPSPPHFLPLLLLLLLLPSCCAVSGLALPRPPLLSLRFASCAFLRLGKILNHKPIHMDSLTEWILREENHDALSILKGFRNGNRMPLRH